MKKNIATTNKNSKLALTKSKNLMGIADKILAKKTSIDLVEDDSWMQRLWDWADEKNISESILPRNREELLSLTEIKIGFHIIGKMIITEIPKEIGNLTNLTKLCFGINGITEIPKEIGNLTNLTVLNLTLNKISKIPKEIAGLTSLTKLDLVKNSITSLPKEICSLTSLEELNLKYNFDLILTHKQKEWINKLQENGCKVEIDNEKL